MNDKKYRMAPCFNFRCLVKQTKFFIVILVINSSLFVAWSVFRQTEDYHCFTKSKTECGTSEDSPLVVFPNANPSSNSIIFIEGHGNNFITPRMWCAVESAAYVHPNHSVFVLMTSTHVRSSPLMEKIILKWPNIKIVHLNVSALLENSPVAKWYKAEKWKASSWPKSHLSDILRWAVLWKYGGIYLDIDVVIMKSLADLMNFTGLESETRAAAGVIGFSKGHPIIEECLKRINDNYDPSQWGSVGPLLISRVLQERCGMELPSGKCKTCPEITVYPPNVFYPIPWWKWSEYLNKDYNYQNILEDPETRAIHVWNEFTKHHPVNLQENNLYAIAASEFCPQVVNELQTVF